MNLTRVHLNPQRQGARKLLSSPQAMHAAVLAGFPPGASAGRVLWRVDTALAHQTTLWIVSACRPDLTHLEEQAGWPQTPTAVSASYDGFLHALAPEQTWAFRLTANPTHRGRVGDRKMVLAHVTAAQQLTWLLDRADSLGVALLDERGLPTCTVASRSTNRFRRGDGSVTLATATFTGVCRVVDTDRLRHALVAGVGRGKAYGCGLLTLARP